MVSPMAQASSFMTKWDPMENPKFFFSLIAIITVIYCIRSYFRGPQAVNMKLLKGKVVVVTGGYGGIGQQLCIEFAQRGATVLMAGRDAEKGREAAEFCRNRGHSKKVLFWKLDLNSFDSVNTFAGKFKEKYDRLDVLINNAGVMLFPTLELTPDGFENHFQSNYLGHFLLTLKLTDILKATPDSRVVNVAAISYSLGALDLEDVSFEKKPYDNAAAYAQSKQAVMLFTQRLQEELAVDGIKVFAVHPGVVNSDGQRYMAFRQSAMIRFSLIGIIWFCMKSCCDGAQTIIHVAMDDTVEPGYYIDCTKTVVEAKGCDEKLADELWKFSLAATGALWPVAAAPAPKEISSVTDAAAEVAAIDSTPAVEEAPPSDQDEAKPEGPVTRRSTRKSAGKKDQ